MSGLGKRKKDVLLLYTKLEGGEQWKDYIMEMFDGSEVKLTINQADLQASMSKMGTLCSQYATLLIAMSPNMVTLLEEGCASLGPVLALHKSVVVIKLYVEQEEFDSRISSKYTSSSTWTLLKMGEDVEENKTAIAKVYDQVQQAQAARHGGLPSKRVSFYPDCIRRPEEAVLMVFKEPYKQGQIIQVTIDNGNKIDTCKINDFCYTFKAPCHKEGRAKVSIYCDGKKHVSMPIRYMTFLSLAYTCPIFLCQLLGLDHDDKVGLDKKLAAIYQNSLPQDGALAHIFTPKSILQNIEGTGNKSNEELPTLLHFACKYGLEELCHQIVDTPGATSACKIANKNNMTPLDIAQEEGYEDLVSYIEAYLEMHDYITECESFYERMSGNNLQTVGYLSMGGGDQVPSYTEGRVAPDDDYEIKIYGQRETVVEVSAEDDVTELTPEVPERSPKPARPPKSPMLSSVSVPAIPARKEELRKTCSSPILPRRLPPTPSQQSQEDSEQFLAEVVPLAPSAMGSSRLNELNELQEGFKTGMFSLNDVECLYKAWQDRNHDANAASIKERQQKLKEMKDHHANVLKTMNKESKQKGILSKLTTKKKSSPNISIVHNVRPNQYEHWQGNWAHRGSPAPNRESTISTTSTSSCSSSSSRDSALETSGYDQRLGQVQEDFSESDSELDNLGLAPPVPTSRQRRKSSQRDSWGEKYLQSRQNCPESRLPKPPSSEPVYGRRAPYVPPRVPPRPR